MAKHPHHGRPLLVSRRAGPATLGSEALGFYLVSAKGAHTPICEIRSYGDALSAWHNYLYTGPGKKAASAVQHRRTVEDDDLFALKHTVGEQNDIAMGGFAAMLHSRKRQSWDIWLFGPLLFLGMPVGSLVFELSHYSGRTVFMKRMKNSDVKWWAEFGHVPAGFNRCKVLHTNWFPQVGGKRDPAERMHMTELKALRASPTALVPVPLLPYVRAEWRVLSRIIGQTVGQVYEQEGLAPPHR